MPQLARPTKNRAPQPIIEYRKALDFCFGASGAGPAGGAPTLISGVASRAQKADESS